MKLNIEFDGKKYETQPMEWDDIDRIESVVSNFLLNLQENIASAQTKSARASIRAQLQRTKSEQRKLVEQILRKYLKLSSKDLIDLGFIGSTVLFNKLYKANTEIDGFLLEHSKQPLPLDSPPKTEASSPSPS